MVTEYYAHSLPGETPDKWQKLDDHLHQTAELAGELNVKILKELILDKENYR